ncbi:MAG: gluconokinase [Clostridiaceae bacterium]|nr:gluconokinase [Clostridiaceae bacterium]
MSGFKANTNCGGDLFLGVDLGTSSVRAALFDRNGFQIDIEQREYTLNSPEPGYAELDPERVFQSMLDAVQDCLKRAENLETRLQGMSFSTQMHSFIAVDHQGLPLTPVITWADNRSLPEAESLCRQQDVQELYRRTGCRVQHPMYPLSKILWLHHHQPELFQQTAKFLTLKSWIFHRLFGLYVVDYTDASASALLNIHTLTWDDLITGQILGIGTSRLADPVPCTQIYRNMDSRYAAYMGIRRDLPVAAGSGDGILANLGCGVLDDTAMTCTVGTSGALRITVGEPLLDQAQRTWCYRLSPDKCIAGGAISNGGIILRWLRDNFRATFQADADERDCGSLYALFDQYAAEIPAGSAGLTFLPLLAGERSPNWNARARGVISGLDLTHTPRHLVKAAMEGVVYRLFSVYETLTVINHNVRQIRANGGYARSEVWLQIQADVFGKEIAVNGVGEAAALGAAYLSMASVGAIGGLDQPLPAMQVSRVLQPNPENTAVYQEGYRTFVNLYHDLYQK